MEIVRSQEIRDRPPNWAGLAPIPLRDNVDLDGPPTPAAVFRRGDANGDTVVELADAVYTLAWRFIGGPAPACPDAAYANDDGAIERTWSLSLLGNWLEVKDGQTAIDTRTHNAENEISTRTFKSAAPLVPKQRPPAAPATPRREHRR